MKRTLLFAAITTVFVAFLLIPVFSEDTPKPMAAGSEEMVKRGEYLVIMGACHDCHTPKKFGPKGPEPDFSRALSGHPAEDKIAEIPANAIGPNQWGAIANNNFTAWAGPWGVSFARNLTPDQDTGIGTWTEAMFIKAIRTGKHMGEGRDILPPMPWQMYSHGTDEDLKAIFAYLRSIKPIHNAVPDPIEPATK